MSPSLLKRLMVRATTSPPFPALIRRVLGTGPAIFTLHRFEDPDSGVEGHTQEGLRANLDLVRRLGYRTLPVDELMRQWMAGTAPPNAVSFTVDDGYRDFVARGAPVFKEFDIPVTIFATTGFVDGDTWFWWDRLEYAFDHSKHTGFSIDVDGTRRDVRWSTPRERWTSWQSFQVLLKTVDIETQARLVRETCERLEVDVPARPPAKYAPMTWAECNALGELVTVGAHSVTHPNLARSTPDALRTEIRDSWRRVQQVAARPVPVFCYPYGDPTAFSAEAAAAVRAEGMLAAVTFVDDRLPKSNRDADTIRFVAPRLRYPAHPHFFAQQLVAVDVLKDRVRATLRRGG